MKGFPTSADIYLELDGRKIAVVQSYRAKAAKSSKNVEAFGESEPVATIEGQKSYTVELTRLYATDTAISDGIDFYGLTDFSLVIQNLSLIPIDRLSISMAACLQNGGVAPQRPLQRIVIRLPVRLPQPKKRPRCQRPQLLYGPHAVVSILRAAVSVTFSATVAFSSPSS